MAAQRSAVLSLLGGPEPLLNCLAKELKTPGLTIIRRPDESAYKVIVLELSTPDLDQEKLVHNLTSDHPGQKIAFVIVAPSRFPQKDLEDLLALAKLKQEEASTNLRTLVVFDLYSSETEGLVSGFEVFLQKTIKQKQITVSQNGQTPLYPTSSGDLARAVLRSLFAQNTRGQVFYLAGETYLDLDLGYLLKDRLAELDLELDLDLVPLETKPSFEKNKLIETQAKLNWLPQDNFDQQLKSLIRKIGSAEESRHPAAAYQSLTAPVHLEETSVIKIKRLKRKAKAETLDESRFTIAATEKRGLVKIIALAATFIFVTLIVPYLLLAGTTYLATRDLTSSYQSFRQTKIKEARQRWTRAKIASSWAEFWFRSTLPVSNLIVPGQAKNLNDFLLLLRHGQSFLSATYDTYDLAERYYLAFLGRADSVNPDLLSALRLNLDLLLENLSQVQLLLQQTKLPLGLKNNLNDPQLLSQIQLLKRQLQTGAAAIDVFEKVARLEQPAKILVVVQDDTEIRASGGFLSSVILLTISQNRLIDWQIEPALAVDRLIEGRVEAPPIIRQALGQTQWFFRDSNLDAHFPTAASQMAWYYQRFKNQSLTGVVALNSVFFKNLLVEIGSTDLNDGRAVNRDNLTLLLSNPTADTGVDLLTNLSQAVFQKWVGGQIGFIPFARALLATVAADETSFWFADSTLQSLLPLNLTHEVQVLPCHPQLAALGCLSDTLYLNEANFSVAKINAYLKREQQHQVVIDEQGAVSYILNYLYSYPVPVPANITQNYQAYYQFYLPVSAASPQIELDHQPLPAGKLSISRHGDLLKYEFFLSQTLNTNHLLSLKFLSGQRLNFSRAETVFNVVFLKQAGFSDPLSLSLSYPAFLTPKVLTNALKVTGAGQLEYRSANPENRSFGIIFRNQRL